MRPIRKGMALFLAFALAFNQTSFLYSAVDLGFETTKSSASTPASELPPSSLACFAPTHFSNEYENTCSNDERLNRCVPFDSLQDRSGVSFLSASSALAPPVSVWHPEQDICFSFPPPPEVQLDRHPQQCSLGPLSLPTIICENVDLDNRLYRLEDSLRDWSSQAQNAVGGLFKGATATLGEILDDAINRGGLASSLALVGQGAGTSYAVPYEIGFSPQAAERNLQREQFVAALNDPTSPLRQDLAQSQSVIQDKVLAVALAANELLTTMGEPLRSTFNDCPTLVFGRDGVKVMKQQQFDEAYRPQRQAFIQEELGLSPQGMEVAAGLSWMLLTTRGLGAIGAALKGVEGLPALAKAGSVIASGSQSAQTTGLLWGGLNIAQDNAFAYAQGQPLPLQDINTTLSSFRDGFQEGAVFSGGLQVVGWGLKVTPLADWAMRTKTLLQQGRLTGFSRLAEWGANPLRNVATCAVKPAVIPKASLEGAAYFAGAAVPFKLIDSGFDWAILNLKGQGSSWQPPTTRELVASPLVFAQEGLFFGPVLGVMSLPTSVFKASPNRLAQGLYVAGEIPGLRGLYNGAKVALGQKIAYQAPKDILSQAAAYADAVTFTATWLSGVKHGLQEVGLAPEVAKK